MFHLKIQVFTFFLRPLGPYQNEADIITSKWWRLIMSCSWVRPAAIQ